MRSKLYTGLQGYIKKLREFLATAKTNKEGEEDVKIKRIALRTNENIQVNKLFQ